ncbi:hypothetical protein IW262DRAFT_170351 [Armillaria fumosa]|nr:hypothetical protein IW262DRAFT_170351 [Armillaria fumosa]
MPSLQTNSYAYAGVGLCLKLGIVYAYRWIFERHRLSLMTPVYRSSNGRIDTPPPTAKMYTSILRCKQGNYSCMASHTSIMMKWCFFTCVLDGVPFLLSAVRIGIHAV